MGRSFHLILLLVGVFALSDAQRWVWRSQRSSRRQISSPGVPPAETLGGLPASPLPQASFPSLESLPRSLPTRRSPLVTLPSPGEPLEFRPLSIDISKLPLQTSEEVLPPEEVALSPLAFTLPNPPAGDLLRQNLDLGASLPRQIRQDASSFEALESGLPLSISNLDVRGRFQLGQTEFSRSQALVTAPDISLLPLQGSTENQGLDSIGFVSSPTGLQESLVQSSGSGENVRFPEKIESFTAENGRDRLILATPRPVRVILENIPSLDASPFLPLKKSAQTSKKETNPRDPKSIVGFEDFSNQRPLEESAVFPKGAEKFSHSIAEGAIEVVEAPRFSRLSDTVADGTISASSYVFPPPTALRGSSLALQKPSLPTRPSRSPLRASKPEPREDKGMTVLFKKPSGLNKERRVPSFVWLWPGETPASRAAKFFTRPSLHAL
ncbi:uncharacterized protein LOC125043823 [Penaeus chinensis]|uniref:uncharacterized protein LOC125043823 n=1 Tax=Penaeus chinensis TaxID=139456 RepID=UPI001FB6C583|nr:uncharacterized protein LOC125043823 [Penaeus chinensis]